MGLPALSGRRILLGWDPGFHGLWTRDRRSSAALSHRHHATGPRAGSDIVVNTMWVPIPASIIVKR